MSNQLRSWLKFNAVGMVGVGVQLLVLAILATGLSLHYLTSTFLAVEAAVIHNFVWHERWTWADRGLSASGVVLRFVKFNLTNGLISIAGNFAIMWLLVGRLGMHYLPANIIAIGSCSLINFFASDRLVFRASRRMMS